MKHFLKCLFVIAALLLPSNAGGDTINILAPIYSNPNFSPDGQIAWSGVIDTVVKSNGSFKVRVILNPDTGPGQNAQILSDRFNEYFVNNGALAQQFIEEGGELIGYVSTLSGNRPLSEVTDDIDEYMTGTYSGKVAGVFLDDFYNNPDSETLAYYQSIYTHIQTNHPGAIIIGNAGNVGVINDLSEADALSLISPLDTLVSHEMAQAVYENSFTELEVAEAFGNSNLGHVIHTADDWDGSLLDLAIDRKAGWFYATTDGLSQDPPNPWDEFDTTFWNSLTDSVIAANADAVLLGDVNLDGAVSFLDIAPFISVLSSGEFQAEADCDESEVVNFLDISPFIAILTGS